MTVNESLLHTLSETGIRELCPKADLVTPEYVNNWHERGFRARVQRGADEDLMRIVVLSGADGATYNNTPELTEFLENH